MRVIARSTARRVLGRGLEEIQQAVPPETGRDREKRNLFSFNYGATGDSERDFDIRRLAKGTPPSILNHPEKPLSLELGLAVPVPDIARVTRPDMSLSDVTFSGHKSKLAAFTHRAIDEFLGTGAHRTQALRGFLSHLTQEDLSTVLAECAVQIDDEHLRESVRMLGPDEVQALNWTAQAEMSERMMLETAADTGGGGKVTDSTERDPEIGTTELRSAIANLRQLEIERELPESEERQLVGLLRCLAEDEAPNRDPELSLRGFPLRPLTPAEHREPVDWSENGNPLLEKDVELAVEYLVNDYPCSLQDENALACRLERVEGWNGIYAGEVAQEAWARYYREREEE